MSDLFKNARTRTPIPFNAEAGAEAVARLDGLDPELQPLIEGAAGCSPYLRNLMEREGAWLTQALQADPDTVIPDLTAAMDGLTQAQLGPALRQAKRRMALYVGLADLGGVWSVEQVTGALTDFADAAVGLALRAALLPELTRGKLRGCTVDDLPDAAGMFVIAMGKMGARELNYSSDIDLICLFDDSRFAPEDVMEARAVFIKATRRMAALLNDITAEGYVFRTDLRLRPDASVTPVCMAAEAAMRYYESVGRGWERAAYIKARICAGDHRAGQAFLDGLRPFVWRRHLDFAAIEDAHQMRHMIRKHKGLHGDKLEGRDLKLASGGIREIEFFTQTHQIIAGGRDASLRVSGTVEGLARLAAAGWIPDTLAQTLTTIYRAHREVEHRLQMVADAHTHALPKTPEGFDRIACMMGCDDTAAWKHALLQRIETVAEATDRFYRPEDDRPAPQIGEVPEVVERWQNYPALRSPRAVEIFERVKPDLIARLNAAARPDEAYAAFDGFLAGLPAGVQLFAMFEANPQLRELIVDIAATAPALAGYLSRNARVLDAVIGGDFFAPWPGQAALEAELVAYLKGFSDYESQLDAARRWTKEWHFRVGVHHLRKLTDASKAGTQYADLAQAVVAAILPVVVAQLSRRHGPPPGQGAMVLAMGSLGAGWLNAHSDLDMIVIYDADGEDSSNGDRPLATRTYYARLTQSLVTALSAATAEGRLYEVDMRLRPSGRQGPVATSFASFATYQRSEAWTWEHLALTRARAVAGPDALRDRVEAVREEIITLSHDREKVAKDIIDMRARLAAAKGNADPLSPKTGAGRMQDIELFGQGIALLTGRLDRTTVAQLDHATALGIDPAPLQRSYEMLQKVQSVARLTMAGEPTLDNMGEAVLSQLCTVTGMADAAALTDTIAGNAQIAADLITTCLETLAKSRKAETGGDNDQG